jgi:endonuclease/exonuclease/phosphatase family metal-dependent hydrolase
MSAPLKLVCLNIERSKHLDLVIPFLKRQQADVVCLQELQESDVALFEKELGSRCVFAPMVNHPPDEGSKPIVNGDAVLTRLPIQKSAIRYYAGDGKNIEHEAPKYIPAQRGFVAVDVEKEGTVYRIVNTHFTWTPDGKLSDEQRRDIAELFRMLAAFEEFVLVGDFNAPRGGEIFGMLAQRYKDNVPTKYETSLDILLHRVGKTNPQELASKMVDGIFSTPGYSVSEVKMISGVSDHCAIVATIAKNG